MTPQLTNNRTEEFIQLYSEHSQRIYRYIRSMIPSRVDAEEIYQNSCTVLWSKFNQFQTGSNFWAWSCKVVRYEVLNFLRRKNLEQRVFSDEFYAKLAEQAVVLADDFDRQHAALADCYPLLTDRQKEIIEKIYLPDATTKKVAKALGRTPNAIYKSLHRAHQVLLNCITSRLAMGEHR